MSKLNGVLKTGRFLSICGAFDGLSARLVERAGFDGVWASGFSITASKAIPDASILDRHQLVDRVAEMTDRVSIPVIVDCDEGYGSLENTVALVEELAKVGVEGISIEDNSYPKLNSLLPNAKRKLVSPEVHCQRIEAIRKAVPDMVVIARTEAIIADLGVDEAISRGVAYAQSGADMILIHSRFTEIAQFEQVTSKWQGLRPLVVVPTMAPGLNCDDIAKLGFRMVIFANQVLRASVLGVEQMLDRLINSGRPSTIVQSLSTLENIFELTGLTVKGVCAEHGNGKMSSGKRVPNADESRPEVKLEVFAPTKALPPDGELVMKGV